MTFTTNYSISFWSQRVVECRFHQNKNKLIMGHSSLIYYSFLYLIRFIAKHTHISSMGIVTYPSSWATFHQWCWNSPPITLTQHDAHFHQKKIIPITNNPFHHWIQIYCATPMKKKMQKQTMSQPYFGQVWGWSPTLGKTWDWSPPGLPKTQKTIWKTKTPRIGVFLVSLERSWNVDIENALAFSIWTSAAQVMGKGRAGSQTDSLTPDH